MNPNLKQYTFDLLNAEGLVVYRNGIDWQGKFERCTGNIVWLNGAREKPEVWLFTMNPTAVKAQILEYDPLLDDCTYLETIFKKDVDGTSIFHKHLFDELETLADAKSYRMSDMSDMDEGNGDYSVILNICEGHDGEQFNLADAESLDRLRKWLRPNPVFLGREFKPAFEMRAEKSDIFYGLEIDDLNYVLYTDDLIAIFTHAGDCGAETDELTETNYTKPVDALGNTAFEHWVLKQRDA